MFLLLFFKNFGQGVKYIDVGISYDQEFVKTYGSEQAAIDAIYDIIDKVNDLYLPYGIQFNPIVPIRLQLQITGNFSIRNQVSDYFKNKTCFDKDVIHHFTTIDNIGIGTSSGLSLCDVNFGGSYPVSFSRHNNLPHDWTRAAHELAHDIGLSHVVEDDAQCIGNYLMCPKGVQSVTDPILFTQGQIDYMASGITLSEFPCAFAPPTYNCEVCEVDFSKVADTETLYGVGCPSGNLRDIDMTFKNNCSIDRDANFEFSYIKSEVSPIEINIHRKVHEGQIIEVIPSNSTTTVLNNGLVKETKYYNLTGNAKLKKDEVIIFHYQIDLIGGHISSNQKFQTEVNFKANIQGVAQIQNLNSTFVYTGIASCTYTEPIEVTQAEYFNNCGCYHNPDPTQPISFCKDNQPIKLQVNAGLKITGKVIMCKNMEINFVNNSKLTVESNAELIIDGAKLYTCSTNLWKGIVVKSGGKLTVQNGAVISNAYKGITIESGAIVSIDHTNIIDCYIGVELPTGSDLRTCTANTFATVNGVKPTFNDAPFWTERMYCAIQLNDAIFASVVGNSFNNIEYGIRSWKSGITVMSNTMSKMNTAIFLSNCEVKKAIVDDNDILFKNSGIELFMMKDASVSHNILGNDGVKDGRGGPVGIALRGLCTSNKVENNIIELQSPYSIAILSSSSSVNDVKDNVMTDNYSNTASSGVVMVGGNANTIQCNYTGDYENGLFFNNATGNIIDCNSITAVEMGINVDINGLMQLMQGNVMEDATTLLKLQSPVGKQVHHGNVWPGSGVLGADASILSASELANSQFFVDFSKSDNQQKHWYPGSGGQVNSLPIELFKDQLEGTTPTYTCQACNTGWVVFAQWFNGSTSPESICQWIKSLNNRLKIKQARWWKAYLYRLIKKSGRPYASLPACLKQIVNEVDTTKLRHIESIRQKFENPSINSNVASALATSYASMAAMTTNHAKGLPWDEASYENEVSILRGLIDGVQPTLSSVYTDIATDISFLAQDSLYNDEVILYDGLLNRSISGGLPTNNQLKLIAEKCSDEDGENIFIAKDLLSLVESVDALPAICSTQDNSIDNRAVGLFSKVSPSVSQGMYSLYLDYHPSLYEVTMTTVDGVAVGHLHFDNGNHTLDLADKAPGMYIITVVQADNKNKDVHKIIKQ